MSNTTMTTAEVLAAIARERARFLGAVDALGDGALTIAVTPEGWTAKDLVAHCIHWAGQITGALGAPLVPPPYVAAATGRPTADEWNALAVGYYRAASLAEVRAELERIIDLLVVAVRRRSDAAMNATDAVPWAGSQPLWRLIADETFDHWPEHADQIEAAAQSAGRHPFQFTLAQGRGAPIPAGRRSAELFSHGSMTVRYYAPRGTDDQTPHEQDEVYVVAVGSGTFQNGPDSHPFEAGDMLFVPAGREHRFLNFSADFATWVVFYGPAGGEQPA